MTVVRPDGRHSVRVAVFECHERPLPVISGAFPAVVGKTG